MVERSERITVRLTPNEEKWIIENAKKGGISKSRYMRKVVLGELAQANIPYRKKDRRLQFKNGVSQSDMEKLLERDLPKLGNNLNQLTRHVNETRNIGVRVMEEIKDIRKKLGAITDTILKALR